MKIEEHEKWDTLLVLFVPVSALFWSVSLYTIGTGSVRTDLEATTTSRQQRKTDLQIT